jgi:hypothetical protein
MFTLGCIRSMTEVRIKKRKFLIIYCCNETRKFVPHSKADQSIREFNRLKKYFLKYHNN